MTKILFIDSVTYQGKVSEHEIWVNHPGLLYLCGALRQRFGRDYFDIKVIYKDIDEHLRDFKPDVVAITSVSQNYTIAKKYAELAKRAGKSVIIGGVHISAVPYSLTDDMDAGVLGEGEETIIELLELYEKEKAFTNKDTLRSIKGIVYKENGRIVLTESRPLITPLDKIPYQARDLAYGKQYPRVFTSRGCPYKCNFCFIAYNKGKIRFFPVDYVVEEIKELAKKHNYIRIEDDLFIANKKRLAEIVASLTKLGIPKRVTFNCTVRANMVDDKTARLLKEMNVTSISIGIESGVQRILTYLKGDNVTVEDNRRSIEILKKHGIQCAAGIIIGAPTETKEEILETLKFVKESRLDRFWIFLLTPFPGTPVWNYALQKGLVSNDMDYSLLKMEFGENPDKVIVLSEVLSKKELYELYKLFEKEKRTRDLKAIFLFPFREIKNQPLLFLKKLLRYILGGQILFVAKFYYLIIKKVVYGLKNADNK